MANKSASQILSEIEGWLEAMDKKAEPSDPGTSHPSNSADDGTVSPNSGAAASENEKGVKENVGPGSVNSTTPSSGSAEPKGDSTLNPVEAGKGPQQGQPGMTQPDPGTAHPANTEKAAGKKYATAKEAYAGAVTVTGALVNSLKSAADEAVTEKPKAAPVAKAPKAPVAPAAAEPNKEEEVKAAAEAGTKVAEEVINTLQLDKSQLTKQIETIKSAAVNDAFKVINYLSGMANQQAQLKEAAKLAAPKVSKPAVAKPAAPVNKVANTKAVSKKENSMEYFAKHATLAQKFDAIYKIAQEMGIPEEYLGGGEAGATDPMAAMGGEAMGAPAMDPMAGQGGGGDAEIQQLIEALAAAIGVAPEEVIAMLSQGGGEMGGGAPAAESAAPAIESGEGESNSSTDSEDREKTEGETESSTSEKETKEAKAALTEIIKNALRK